MGQSCVEKAHGWSVICYKWTVNDKNLLLPPRSTIDFKVPRVDSGFSRADYACFHGWEMLGTYLIFMYTGYLHIMNIIEQNIDIYCICFNSHKNAEWINWPEFPGPCVLASSQQFLDCQLVRSCHSKFQFGTENLLQKDLQKPTQRVEPIVRAATQKFQTVGNKLFLICSLLRICVPVSAFFAPVLRWKLPGAFWSYIFVGPL